MLIKNVIEKIFLKLIYCIYLKQREASSIIVDLKELHVEFY